MSLFRIAARASALPRIAVTVSRSATTTQRLPFRSFSAAAGLSKEDIETRVLDVLKGFEKVDKTKVCLPGVFNVELLTRPSLSAYYRGFI